MILDSGLLFFGPPYIIESSSSISYFVL